MTLGENHAQATGFHINRKPCKSHHQWKSEAPRPRAMQIQDSQMAKSKDVVQSKMLDSIATFMDTSRKQQQILAIHGDYEQHIFGLPS